MLDLDRLTVARLQARSEALGPGVRAIIWFHGCSFNCRGCIAEEMNRSPAFQTFRPLELAEWALGISGIEGLTLSGGDPFDQSPASLGEFLQAVRSGSDLSVVSYTGRTLAELQQDDRWSPVVSSLDMLIDGLYVEELNDGSLWRGSSNQQIHFLTDRYRSLHAVQAAKGRRLDVRLAGGQRIEITGIPPRGFMNRLREDLALHGLQLDLEDPMPAGASSRAQSAR